MSGSELVFLFYLSVSQDSSFDKLANSLTDGRKFGVPFTPYAALFLYLVECREKNAHVFGFFFMIQCSTGPFASISFRKDSARSISLTGFHRRDVLLGIVASTASWSCS